MLVSLLRLKDRLRVHIDVYGVYHLRAGYFEVYLDSGILSDCFVIINRLWNPLICNHLLVYRKNTSCDIQGK